VGGFDVTFVPRGRALAAVAIAVVVGLSAAVPIVLAHEERQVAGYDIEIGLIGEPVYVGDRSGLELFVHKGDQPVMGLEKTLKTAVAYGDRSNELPLSAREGDAGVILGLVALGVALGSRRSGSGDEVGPETAPNPGEAGAAPGSRRRRS
jgi:hypothetical protein